MKSRNITPADNPLKGIDAALQIAFREGFECGERAFARRVGIPPRMTKRERFDAQVEAAKQRFTTDAKPTHR